MNRKRYQAAAIVLLLVGTFFIFSSSVIAAGERKIVVFQEGVADAVKQGIIVDAGCQVVKLLPLVDGIVIHLPEQASDKALEAILAHAPIIVIRVDEDLEVYATKVKPSDPGGGTKPKPEQPEEILPWGVDRIDADLIWDADGDLVADVDSTIGVGIKVAILDTGISIKHPDLANNIAGGINIINYRKSYNDDNGHGTHCAGIVAGVDNNIGVIGTAPGASLYGVKVLDRKGQGWLSDVIDGLDWCINNGIDVINMSFGSSGGNQTFQDAITKVYQAGIVQVAAAGNEYWGPVNYPAAYPETIAVSAIDSSDNFAYFSSAGPEIDLTAPGVDILSTYKGEEYKSLSGTSMACPHVAGVVALIVEIQPIYTPDEVLDVLIRTAEDLGLPVEAQGAGLVDTEGAVLATEL